jgi:hypothetical protein
MPTRSSTAERLTRRIRPRSDAPRVSRWRVADPAQPAAERRDRDPSQDTAVYTCQCGMVFEAMVNTSVDCPHCGGQQAW